MLRIAVQSKGRLFEETMALLQEADIKISSSKRILLVQSSNFPIEVLFLRDDDIPQSVAGGVYYLRICCGINSLIYAAMYTLDSFAIGVSAANVAMINALLDAVIVRLPMSWILAFALNMGFPGIYYGQALSPVLPAIVGLLYFMSKKWERKTLIQSSNKGRSH